jgi:hypothetical protein
LLKDFTFAATSDGSKIAVTEMITDSNLQSLCRIVVVDGRTKEVTRSPLSFPSRSVLTGAGHWLLAPKLFWLDDNTLLVAAADRSSQLGGIVDTQKLYRYQTSTQSIEELCNLPKFTGQVFDPRFSLGDDEAGKHSKVEVRRSAVAALRHSVNKAVDEFMQQAVEDSDALVASMAGRYVAARQNLPLQRWLFDASLKMTPAGLVAARSIVRELEQLSQQEHGKVPSGKFEEVIADPAKVAEYSATLKAWIVYCITHPRSVEAFFDKVREQNSLWQGFVIDRYASGENEPIRLNPRITHTIQD